MRAVRHGRVTLLLLLVAGLALLLAACEDADDPDEVDDEAEAAIPAQVDLDGLEITVGSKEFTEQLILGYIAVEAFEAAGATVNDEVGLGGTGENRTALESGEIDLYWEYTGTGWITHLDEVDPVPGAQEQYEAVADRDRDENSIVWLEPAEPNNTYALAVSSESHAEYGFDSISDLAEYARDNPDEITICGTDEFMVREDGLPGLEAHYDFEIPDGNITDFADPGPMYSEVVDNPDDCLLAAPFATDGRIVIQELVLLEDDQEFFPVYQPAMNVRQEIFDEWSAELEALNELVIEPLDTDTLQEMNAESDEFGVEPRDVAIEYLQENGLIP